MKRFSARFPLAAASAPVAAVAALLTLSACGKPEPAQSATALPVTTVQTTTVREIHETRFLQIPGTVRPIDRATLSPQVMGTVTSVAAELGQAVTAGQVLVEITANEIATKVAQAEIALAQAQRDLDRETALLTQGASTAEMVRNLQDRHRIMASQVEEARTLLTYTRVTAPFTGVITRKFVNEGDLAAPGQPLLELESTGAFRVEAELPESLARIPLGTALTVSLGEVTFIGHLAELSPAANARSRTVLAKIDFPANAAVRSGQYAHIALPNGNAEALLIPAAARSRFGQLERVFVASDGHADLRLVKTGTRRGDDVEVLAGLSAGETVIISDTTHLREGQPLQVRP
jgi:membrane fusion protein (multidrug efflux system)